MRIEQTRFLEWGDKVGLIEDALARPSRVLHLNRNLVVDLLLEVHALLKSCATMGSKYDPIVELKEPVAAGSERSSQRGPLNKTDTLMRKTLGIFERTKELPERLQWAMVKQRGFENLISRLIGYNDSIENLLDKVTIKDLQISQYQANLAMLQLNDKVDQLMDISRAMKIPSQSPVSPTMTSISQGIGAAAGYTEATADVVLLAEFKAQLNIKDDSYQELKPLIFKSLRLGSIKANRSEAIYEGNAVWVEWKEGSREANEQASLSLDILRRVQKLAILLKLPSKPPQFRAPMCVGYVEDHDNRCRRYGFVYEKPPSVSPSTPPMSLLELFTTERRPSLTRRIALANALARCLMYLHSVNWLHKSFRSSNIVLFHKSDRDLDYGAPILAGFDYARPDSVGELTEAPSVFSGYDIYRHPATLGVNRERYSKSHDIYSLGIVLIEVAFWQPIHTFLELSVSQRPSDKTVRTARRTLGSDNTFKELEGLVGETYKGAVERCILGGHYIGLKEDSDETDQHVGADIQRVFSEEIVDKLGMIRL